MLSPTYLTTLETLETARTAFRAQAIAEIQRLTPTGHSAIFSIAEDSEFTDRLHFNGLLPNGHPITDLQPQHTELGETLDRIAEELHFTEYQEAKNHLDRTGDLTHFIVTTP